LGEEGTLAEGGLEGEPPTLRWICSYALTWEGTGMGWEGEVDGQWTGREEGRLGLV